MSRLAARFILLLFLLSAELLYVFSRIIGSIWQGIQTGVSDHTAVLVLGTFHNPGWIEAHIGPLKRAFGVQNVTMVSDQDAIFNEESDPAGTTIGRETSQSQACRLFRATYCALKNRADVVIGYHIMPHGIFAVIVASFVGAKSIYQMTSGPIQLIGGGNECGNRLQRKLDTPSAIVERGLYRWVRRADVVVVRGQNSASYIQENGLSKNCKIITAGIDKSRFHPSLRETDYDVVTACRLVEGKGLQQLISATATIVRSHPEFRLLIIGEGSLRKKLQSHVDYLGLTENVSFVGQVDDVEHYFARSRFFALISESEGMPIAMLEAMMCGLPLLVTSVGDISGLVKGGRHGILLNARPTKQQVVESIQSLITMDEDKYFAIRDAVTRDASALASIDSVADQWQGLSCCKCSKSDANRSCNVGIDE